MTKSLFLALCVTGSLVACGGPLDDPGFFDPPSTDDGGETPTAGDAAGTGGAATTTGEDAGSGGAPAATGGTPATGGAPAAGGSPDGAPCAEPVQHDNGLGDTWEDCAESGTHNLLQAKKACESSGSFACVGKTCDGDPAICGFNRDGDVYACWGYSGTKIEGAWAGQVGAGPDVCNFTHSWN